VLLWERRKPLRGDDASASKEGKMRIFFKGKGGDSAIIERTGKKKEKGRGVNEGTSRRKSVQEIGSDSVLRDEGARFTS